MIYLDNAATSFPKPACVIREQARCMKQYCGNPGRGSHALARRASEKIFECREELAALLGTSHPEQIVFTWNATMALNTVIKGLLQQGDHVLISDMEHNAVLRPICKLAKDGIITYSVFPTHAATCGTPTAICAGILELLRPNTKMLICTHASNICSVTLPLEALGALCRRRGILFVVDASQSAGHLPLDVERMHVDALCAPGHKGLLGPQGTGFFWLREGLNANTLMEGGSGFHSLDADMPNEVPERYEAGTLPTPAIAGLCEGVRTVKQIGSEALHAHACQLNARLAEQLQALSRTTIYTPHRIGSILLFNVNGISADRVGQLLNDRDFCVRTGYHCAPLAHATIGTPAGGAVRVSPSIRNTFADVDAFVHAIKELL